MAVKRDYLLFVDTNIYLDFYRAQHGIGLKLLQRLEGLSDKLISSYQIEMEFKKNRQGVILTEFSKTIKPSAIPTPAFVSELNYVQNINRDIKNVGSRIARLEHNIKRILAYPNSYDKVYKICKKVFNKQGNYSLGRTDERRFNIRKLARKRFCLGYPPRKDKDTFMGDSINWEWIIDCCKRGKKDVVIVSRDSDYGACFKEQCFINDWLSKEFKERVGSRRKIVLTNKLSKGLEALEVKVSKEEKKEENTLSQSINSIMAQKIAQNFIANLNQQTFFDEKENYLSKLNEFWRGYNDNKLHNEAKG